MALFVVVSHNSRGIPLKKGLQSSFYKRGSRGSEGSPCELLIRSSGNYLCSDSATSSLWDLGHVTPSRTPERHLAAERPLWESRDCRGSNVPSTALSPCPLHSISVNLKQWSSENVNKHRVYLSTKIEDGHPGKRWLQTNDVSVSKVKVRFQLHRQR